MTKQHTFDYDVIIIGSGAAGMSAALATSKAGKKTAIIEEGSLGGDSPNWSDIPINALQNAANLYAEAKRGSTFGLRSATMGYNYHSVRAWKDLAIKRTGASGSRKYYENLGIDIFNGSAHFLSPNEISVNRRHLSAHYFVIATGARWVIPDDIPGMDATEYLTPNSITESARPPKTLLVVGSSDTGIAIAQIMAAFGTKVYIAEKSARFLPTYDEDVSDAIKRTFSDMYGIISLNHSRVLSVVKEGLSKRAIISRAGSEKTIRVDEVLIATGRKPNVDLGLENAGVKYTPTGIKVNENLQTSVKHIWAAGAVLGRDSRTHSVLLEGQIVAHNILSRNKIKPDYTATPKVIFTLPNIATVGLSEDDCLKRDLAINKAFVPLSITARSNTTDFKDGFVKIVTDKKGVMLGATIVAPNGAEMIHELGLAVKNELTAHQIATTPHAFLSWSEAIRMAAGKLS